MRFVHTADWQIGMKAAHVGKAAEKVRSARLETIRRIQQLAKEVDAEFILVAGDTFEDLLTEFPDLERDDLRACLAFAAQSLKLKSQHLVLA